MMIGWGMSLGGWIWMAVWIAALLVMVWMIVAAGNRDSSREDALEILRARFARGEIDKEQFERAQEVLLAERRNPTP